MSELKLPSAIFEQHTIILGKTGAGKSSALRYMVEDLLDAGNRVVIVTSKADWWGLKLSADGKHAGYPVVIFGGDHSDMPLNYTSGKMLAELVASGNRSAVLQLRDFMPGERTTFWIDFASHLFRLMQGKLYLVIDEVHNFAPKGKSLDTKASMMLHWSNKLASEARGLGITLIGASQRPAKVHNDFLTSCETLIAMRVTTEWDRMAVHDWIKGCGDPAAGVEVLRTLAQFKRGDAWVWSPEAEFGPKQLHFPMFKTYDSFKPQMPTDKAGLKGWASVNLDDVREKLSALVQEAEANDPSKLQAKIRDLENKLAKGEHAGDALKYSTDPLERHELKRLRIFSACMLELIKQRKIDFSTPLTGIIDTVSTYLESVSASLDSLNKLKISLTDIEYEIKTAAARANPVDVEAAPAERPAGASVSHSAALAHSHLSNGGGKHRPVYFESRDGDSDQLAPGEYKILSAIASAPPGGANKAYIGVTTDYKASSRKIYCGKLISRGLIGWNGQTFVLAPGGREALGPNWEPLPRGRALREYYKNNLPDGEWRCLAAIIEASDRGDGATATGIEEATNYKGSSRKIYVGKLVARGLVNRIGHGLFKPSELLY